MFKYQRKYILLYFKTGSHVPWAGLEPLSAPGPGVRQNIMTEREYKEELLTSVISKTQGEETARGQGMMEHALSDLLLPIRPHLLQFLLLPQIASLARDQAFNISGLRGLFIPKP